MPLGTSWPSWATEPRATSRLGHRKVEEGRREIRKKATSGVFFFGFLGSKAKDV